MWSPDVHALTGEQAPVRHYDATRFDRGARAFAFACGVFYAWVIVEIVRTALGI